MHSSITPATKRAHRPRVALSRVIPAPLALPPAPRDACQCCRQVRAAWILVWPGSDHRDRVCPSCLPPLGDSGPSGVLAMPIGRVIEP